VAAQSASSIRERPDLLAHFGDRVDAHGARPCSHVVASASQWNSEPMQGPRAMQSSRSYPTRAAAPSPRTFGATSLRTSTAARLLTTMI